MDEGGSTARRVSNAVPAASPTNRSALWLRSVAEATRSVAWLQKVTAWPSADRRGWVEGPLAHASALPAAWLTRRRTSRPRSNRYTPVPAAWSGPPGAPVVAKATRCPSSLTSLSADTPSPTPGRPRVTSVFAPDARSNRKPLGSDDTSPAVRSPAWLMKATAEPPASSRGPKLAASAAVAGKPTLWLTSSAGPPDTGRRNTSRVQGTSTWPAITSVAVLVHATHWPSRDKVASEAPASAAVKGRPAAWLSRVTSPVTRSYTNASASLFASLPPATRSVAKLTKATRRPSAESRRCSGPPASSEKPLPAVPAPAAAWLASTLTPVATSCRNTSRVPCTSTWPAVTCVALLTKATTLPSALTLGRDGSSSSSSQPTATSGAPAAWLTSVTTPVARSYRNASSVPGTSTWPGTRSLARLTKTTWRPSPLRAGANDAPLPVCVACPAARLTSATSPVARSARKTWDDSGPPNGARSTKPSSSSAETPAKATKRPSSLTEG